MANINLPLPALDEADDAKMRRQIRNYLLQLDKQLKYALSNLDEENLTAKFIATLNSKLSAGDFSTLVQQTADSIGLVAQRLQTPGSSVIIAYNKVAITTPEFVIAIPTEGAEEVAMRVDINGTYLPELASPTVSARYNGPPSITVDPSGTPSETVLTSLTAALNLINNRFLDYDVTVTVTAGVTLNENVVIRGIYGGGAIIIAASDTATKATINGSVKITDVYTFVRLDGFIINAQFTTGSSNLLDSLRTVYCSVRNCVLNGNAYTYACAMSQQGGALVLNTVEAYNGGHGVYANTMSRIAATNLKGSGFTWNSIYSNGAVVLCTGTIPAGTTAIGANGILTTTGCTTDAGSGTTPPVLTTVSYDATLTGWKQASWSSETYERQGLTSNGQITGCMWFNNTTIRSVLAGKNIESATLKLRRRYGTGKAAAIHVYLHGIAITGKSGTPTLTASYGEIGTLAWQETGTFAIPTAAIDALVAGTINGFALNTGETTYSESLGYSDNYGSFDGTEGVKPQLGITYT